MSKSILRSRSSLARKVVVNDTLTYALPQPQLDAALAQLVGAELVYRRGAPRDAEYTFKHALVQDAAYQSMLKSRRAHLHAHIADGLDSSFPEVLETEPETLARHLTAAALAHRAIPYWLAAGRRAYGHWALKEAVIQLNAGIGPAACCPADRQ